MSFVGSIRSLTPVQRNTFLGSFLAWTLDAFDFFLVTFVTARIASDFGVPITAVVGAITLTLVFRPVGAIIFGYFADKYGRRRPLVINIVLFSILELLCAFSQNLTQFLILRALFGIAMGGVWGTGAALALESLPTQTRGFFSGILQQGYATGFLLASLVFGLTISHVGWRGLFIIGAIPALLAIFIERNVPESEAWTAAGGAGAKRDPFALLTVVRTHWKLALYAIVLMTAFNCMSHGTQDLYPTFLQKERGFAPTQTSIIAIVANIGAIVGGTLFGGFSQRVGRRRAIATATVLGLIVLPFWTGATTIPLLCLGGFMLQFCVQGAWGIIPAHLTELAPGEARGSFPGVMYQLGNLFASPIAQVESGLAATRFIGPDGVPGYGHALVLIASIIFVLVALLATFGPERRTVDFRQTATEV